MGKNYVQLNISLDAELKKDIDFDIMKIDGKIEPNNSYGKYFYEKLRSQVPHRNVKNEDEDID